mgnify:CR=1 FL=1
MWFEDEVCQLHRLGGLNPKDANRKTKLEVLFDLHQTIKILKKP